MPSWSSRGVIPRGSIEHGFNYILAWHRLTAHLVLGQLETIFSDHYGQATEEHFGEARRHIPSIPQITPHQASSMGEKAGTEKKKDSEQNAQSPFLVDDCGEWPKPEEIGGSPKWAMRDSIEGLLPLILSLV